MTPEQCLDKRREFLASARKAEESGNEALGGDYAGVDKGSRNAILPSRDRPTNYWTGKCKLGLAPIIMSIVICLVPCCRSEASTPEFSRTLWSPISWSDFTSDWSTSIKLGSRASISIPLMGNAPIHFCWTGNLFSAVGHMSTGQSFHSQPNFPSTLSDSCMAKISSSSTLPTNAYEIWPLSSDFATGDTRKRIELASWSLNVLGVRYVSSETICLSNNSVTLSPDWNTLASPNNSKKMPTITAHLAISYQTVFFQAFESENSPERPINTSIADPIKIQSEKRTQDLASASDNELKLEIFSSNKIAAITNAAAATALAIFLFAVTIRDLIRHYRNH
jgi:hypothetical protein